jgi:hypothetical protein
LGKIERGGKKSLRWEGCRRHLGVKGELKEAERSRAERLASGGDRRGNTNFYLHERESYCNINQTGFNSRTNYE